MKVDKEKLKAILTQEMEYDEDQADSYLKTFPDELHEKLEAPMKKWLEDRTVEDIQIEGVSLKKAAETEMGKANFLHAIRGLNDLLTRDLSSEEKEALITTLNEQVPYDRIIFRDKK